MPATTPLLLASQLRAHALCRPHREALADAHGKVCYGELVAAIDAVAARLAANRIGKGDRVAIAMRPSLVHACVLLGCMARGAIATSLNIRLAPAELATFLEPIAPALLLTDVDHAGLGDALGLHRLVLPAVNAPGSLKERLDGLWSDTICENHGVEENDDALILPTGGTTGIPKGAVYTQRALWLWGAACSFDEGRSPDDHELYLSPFFHSSIMSGWMSTLFAGGRATIMGAFSAGEVLRHIDTGVNFIMGSPTALEGLLAHPDFAGTDCTGLTKLRIGTSSVSPDLLARLLEAFPHARLQHTYGATEFGPVANIRHADFLAGRITGVGTVRPGARITVVDDNLQPLPSNQPGELVVNCPWRSRGYWGREEETARTYPALGVRSGDIGYFDADGWLTISGRIKDIIVTGGENVFPAEVEEVLGRHPQVAQVIVYGAPDPYWGERIEAAIVPKPGCTPDESILIAFARQHLGGYKLPKTIRFLSDIPLTTMNKPDRRALVRMASGATIQTLSDRSS